MRFVSVRMEKFIETEEFRTIEKKKKKRYEESR